MQSSATFNQQATAITNYNQTTNGVLPIDHLSLGVWGDIKTCKTTFGLTYPKPLIHYDFDQGFERAAGRLDPALKVLKLRPGQRLEEGHLQAGYDIITIEYQVPLQFPGMSNAYTLQLFSEFVTPDIFMGINCPWIKSLLYDTGTVLWKTVTQAELESKQSRGTRQRLIQVEYATPNQNMRFFLGAPKSLGKNLYIPHHMVKRFEDQFAGGAPEPVGQKQTDVTWDGWSRMGGIVDAVLVSGVKRETVVFPPIVGQPPQSQTFIIPAMTVQTSGYTLKAETQELQIPTFDMVLNLINTCRAEEQQELGYSVVGGP